MWYCLKENNEINNLIQHNEINALRSIRSPCTNIKKHFLNESVVLHMNKWYNMLPYSDNNVYASLNYKSILLFTMQKVTTFHCVMFNAVKFSLFCVHLMLSKSFQLKISCVCNFKDILFKGKFYTCHISWIVSYDAIICTYKMFSVSSC